MYTMQLIDEQTQQILSVTELAEDQLNQYDVMCGLLAGLEWKVGLALFDSQGFGIRSTMAGGTDPLIEIANIAREFHGMTPLQTKSQLGSFESERY